MESGASGFCSNFDESFFSPWWSELVGLTRTQLKNVNLRHGSKLSGLCTPVHPNPWYRACSPANNVMNSNCISLRLVEIAIVVFDLLFHKSQTGTMQGSREQCNEHGTSWLHWNENIANRSHKCVNEFRVVDVTQASVHQRRVIHQLLL